MKEYSLEQVFDYLDCSLRYEMKYTKKLPPLGLLALDDKSSIYKDCIQETIYFYYIQHQQGHPPTLKKVYEKFYSLWLDRTQTHASVSILTRSLEEASDRGRKEKERYVTNGYKLLKSFYDDNATRQQAVIAVNHPYEITFDGIRIAGTFELIREVLAPNGKMRTIEAVSFRTSTRKPDDFQLRHDLYSTFMHYAFLQTFQTRPDRFSINYLGLNTELQLDKTNDDYKRMLAVLAGFAAAVEQVPPFPRQGLQCKFCPFQQYCDCYPF